MAGSCDPQRLLELITEFIDRGISTGVGRDRSIEWPTQMINESGRRLPSPGFHTLP